MNRNYSRRYWKLMPCLCLLALIGPVRAQRALSLQDAIHLAVQESQNPQVRLQQERVMEARAGADLARAALLPHLSGRLVEQNRTVNLESFGIAAGPGFRPPKLVGPFTTFDARASLSQNILDLGAIHRYRAATRGVEAAESRSMDFQDTVAAETAEAYLEALQAKSELERAEADMTLAGELAELAENRKEAGTGTRIEVTRAGVQVAVARQDLVAAQNRLGNALLVLKRLTGLDYSIQVDLTDSMEQPSIPFDRVEEAIDTAWEHRTDLLAQQKSVESLELAYSATRMDRVPSLQGFADYGTIGSGPNSSIPTWTLGISLDLPIFDGGAVDARRAEQLSRLRQAQIQLEDLQRQVELEVRLGFGSVRLVREQLHAAGERLALARDELEQARRRYAAGVSIALEITEAQARLKEAERGRIGALFNYNLARIRLLEATGTLRTSS